MGDSFAIPTKDINIHEMPLERVEKYIAGFLAFAEGHKKDLVFHVTRIGCGLAGFTDLEIGPLFADAPSNCLFDTAWEGLVDINGEKKYWGTF